MRDLPWHSLSGKASTGDPLSPAIANSFVIGALLGAPVEGLVLGFDDGSFDGDTDGTLLGLDDGDWLGVDVGCETNDSKFC